MHAYDLAAWLLKICKSSNYSCPTYNVGSDESINVSQLAFKLAKKNGLKVIFKSKDKEELDYYVPSVKNAKKKIKIKNYTKIQNWYKILFNINENLNSNTHI
mgnify:CR=1 FL=1